MINFDYASNTPVNIEVLEEFVNINKKYTGNPNSPHILGKMAKEQLDIASEGIANIIGVKKSELIFTSGATESNNLAIKGVAHKYRNKGRHIITTELEHSSVFGAIQTLADEGFEIEIVKINEQGQVDINHLKEIIREDTILITIAYVDGELGICQDINGIADIIKKYPNCVFHTDATQAIGKTKVDFTNIHMATFAPHKFNGLNGFGVLVKKEGILIEPIIHGGLSTTVFRSGTPDVAMVVACEKALKLTYEHFDENLITVSNINTLIYDYLLKIGIMINSTSHSVPHILSISVKGTKGIVIANMLEEKGVCVSTKASCCPTNTMSRAVYAICKDRKRAFSVIRLSFSHLSTENEAKEFIEIFGQVLSKILFKN